MTVTEPGEGTRSADAPECVPSKGPSLAKDGPLELGRLALPGAAPGALFLPRLACLFVGVLLGMAAHAEQFRDFGDWRVHYIAVGASFLPVEVAERHGIVRGDNKALVNISAIGADGRSGAIGIAGTVTNLLGQTTPLRFREVRDGAAIYYLAPFDFEDAETLRFELRLTLPDHGEETLSFQQPLYRPLP